MADTPRLWPHCGYYTLTVTSGGRLQTTPAFLALLWQRPEVVPVTESCEQEQQLHASLIADPARPVSLADLRGLADPDAADNYQVVLAFRQLLARYPDLESAYLAVVSGQETPPPPVLLDWLVQLINCHLLQDGDPYQWRASECLFRVQQISVKEGVVAADADYLHTKRPAETMNLLQSLIRQAGGTPLDSTPEVQALNKSTVDHYQRHSEAHDLALGLNPDEPGGLALAQVLTRWVAHFHELAVTITPVGAIDDDHWRWHIGLDAEANRLLNALYQGETLADETLRSLVALYRLECEDTPRLLAEVAGRPIYLGMAMDGQQQLRLKPQNLLLNLPLRPH